MPYPIPSKPAAEVSAAAFAAKDLRQRRKNQKNLQGTSRRKVWQHATRDKHGPHGCVPRRHHTGREGPHASRAPMRQRPDEREAGGAGMPRISLSQCAPTPLLRWGERSDVRACGYTRPTIPQGVWKSTLNEAENEAMRLANDYLARARDHARALLPEYRTRARVHYDWDTAMETFSDLSEDDEPRDGLLPIDDGSSSEWQRLTREQQIVELTFGSCRHAWKSVQRSKLPENTVRMQNFRLVDAVAKNYHNGPKIVNSVPVEETRHTFLSGDSLSTIESADGFPVVVHLPGGLRGKTLDDVTDAIEEWGRAAKPSPKGANDMNDCYKKGYALAGRTRLATLWHPVGHKNDPPVVCADVRKTGQSYEGAFKLFAELDLVNSFCTTALLAIDPLHYGLLRRVYDWRRETHKSQVAISALDKYNLWEGREIMFNRWSKPHWDHNDPHYSWACIVYFGSFTEARMKFRQLNAEVRLRRGDVVFLRGRDVLHEVADWGDGERHFMVYFTHESLWDGAGVESRVTPM